jgi:predicted Zn finger-like uncharacterized protein
MRIGRVMRIECPECSVCYDIEAEIVDASLDVRCAKCEHVWTVVNPGNSAEETIDITSDIDHMLPDIELDDIAFGDNDEDDSGDDDNDEVDADTRDFVEALRVQLANDTISDGWGDAQEETGQEETEDNTISAATHLVNNEAPEKPRPEQKFDEYLAVAYTKKKPPIFVHWHSWLVFLLVASGIVASIMLMRQQIVRALPGAASLYAMAGIPINVRGLVFHDVAYRWITTSEGPALEVSGAVVNISEGPVEVPKVVFSLLSANGYDFFQWSAKVHDTLLLPYQHANFKVRGPSGIGADAHSIKLRFLAKYTRTTELRTY